MVKSLLVTRRRDGRVRPFVFSSWVVVVVVVVVVHLLGLQTRRRRQRAGVSHCRAKLSIGRLHLDQLLAAERYYTVCTLPHFAVSVKESVEMAGLVNNNLWNLCRSGELDQVKAALEAGADPNTTEGQWSWTCLMVAVWNRHVDMVDLLLSHPRIDVNAKDIHLDTALHLVFSNEAILHKLLATPGLLLNEKNSTGETPIMSAARRGWVGAVKLMAAKEQVDLDVRDIEGRSLEEMGLRFGNAELAQVVVEARQRRRWGEFIIHPSE